MGNVIPIIGRRRQAGGVGASLGTESPTGRKSVEIIIDRDTVGIVIQVDGETVVRATNYQEAMGAALKLQKELAPANIVNRIGPYPLR